MRNNLKYVAVACGLMFGLSACVQDLNTEPIDKNSATAFNQDAVFSKCYATLATTGQKGPDGDCDIDDLDEGTSSFYRMMWELNEFGTDEGWWIWNDVGLADIRVMNWNGDNALVKGLYYRLNIDIKICNHFLYNTEGATDEKTLQQRAEVRFIRAFNYWYLLDMFKVAPFSTTESSELPEFVERPALYEWLVGELKELTEILPEERLSIYRIDKYAAWMLLARTYINAEVYTGKPAWEEAKDAADKAMSGPYQLHKKSITSAEGIKYSAYQQLFMGDNHKNGAQQEIMLLAYQDGVYCQSWGGSRFLVNMVRDADMVPAGSADTWKCFRSSPEFIYKFVDEETAPTIKADEYQMPALLGDDRAIMCSYVDANSTDSLAKKSWKLTGTQTAEFYDCWAVLKFTGVPSTADRPSKAVTTDPNWPDTDLPWLRVAEAYMIKAEALFRLGDKNGALAIINNDIRSRANAAPLTDLDEATLCDEYCREFYCEGHRRSDLVRFNRFAGPQADNNRYNWEGRAGKNSGENNFASTDEKWNWYPIPNDDKASNKNYATTQGDGY
ncbi:MAG: RagB/SusD family nutrient uptake outer membrane protein [Paludibacteraceae bacterium]|nr:RagB/SusD family nutrient uptake outer membrane protein [Paludibacteraceae bacterium]